MSSTTQKIIDQQNFYETTMTSATIWSGDISFTVGSTPVATRWYVAISPDVFSKREIAFYTLSGATVVIKKENRFGPNYSDHSSGEKIQFNSVAQFVNFSQEIASTTGWIEKTGWLGIKVYGWPVLVNGYQKSPADWTTTLPINATSYVYFDASTNTFWSTTNFSVIDAFQHVSIADIVTNSTTILSLTYRNFKFGHVYFDTSSFSINGSGKLTINPVSIPTVPWSPRKDSPVSGTIDGSNVSFTLSATPSGSAWFSLFKNWLLQTDWSDYSRSGTSITTSVAPLPWDTLTAQYLI